jgi:ribonucleoside-diphosphate reductase alpha chain
MGVKCVALFRSDSKGISVYDSSTPEGQKWDPTNIWNRLVESTRERTEALVKDASKPRRIKLPGRRISQTVKFSIAGQLDGFLTVGVYPDGTCGEVFGRVGQGGSFVSGMFDAFCKSFSISLQYGVPLKDVIESFRYMAFDPAGFTKVGDTDGATEEIRNCKSVVDLMMQILGWLFPDSRLRDMTFVESGDVELPTKNGPAQITAEPPVTTPAPKVSETSKNKSAQACPKCSSLAYVHDGKCRSCRECGFKDGGCGE